MIKSPDFRSLFCKSITISFQTGQQCLVPFNWSFQIPTEWVGDGYQVLLQAQGGRGGNGGVGGQAQAVRSTAGLADSTLYAWVADDGLVSATHGGGGGGASVLATTSDPFNAVTPDGVFESDILLIAGGGGGGVSIGECSGIDGQGVGTAQSGLGGQGGVAIAFDAGAARASGVQGKSDGSKDGLIAGGFGATWSPSEGWASGARGAQGGNLGTNGTGFSVYGGLGGGQAGPAASTVASFVLPTPIIDNSAPGRTSGSGGNGGSGYCQGGGGGAGAAAGGGGSGGTSQKIDGGPVVVNDYGGGGGGGGSYAIGSDVDPSLIPDLAQDWLTLPDQTVGFISLFFYQISSGPPAPIADGATVDTVQPTIGFETSGNQYSYRVFDDTTKTYLSSPLTTNSLWTIPDGLLTPGATYTWGVVDDDGNTVPLGENTLTKSFTVSADAQRGSIGLNVEMRSMLNTGFLPPGQTVPPALQPDAGQNVPVYSARRNGLTCATCEQWTVTVGNPSNYSTFFQDSSPFDANQQGGSSVNNNWATWDPFGLGLAQLFTLRYTGRLTVPLSGAYTFALNTAGGARVTLTDPFGAVVGSDPLVDSWSQIPGGNCVTQNSFFDKTSGISDFMEAVSITTAINACINSNALTQGAPVELEAGVAYNIEVDGFMSWVPGPMQLLFAAEPLGNELAPVPLTWFDCPDCTLDTAPTPVLPSRGVDDIDAVQRSTGVLIDGPREVGAGFDPAAEDVDRFGPLGVGLVSGAATATIGSGPTQLAYRGPGGADVSLPDAGDALPTGWDLVGPTSSRLFGDGGTCAGVAPPVDGSDVYLAPDGLLCGWTDEQGETTNVWYVRVGDNDHQVGWLGEPDGASTQLFWTTDGSTAQLAALQTSHGASRQARDSIDEAVTSWFVNYQPSGDVASLVSPQPGVNGARGAVAYRFEVANDGALTTSIFDATVPDPADTGAVVVGALREQRRYAAGGSPIP
ncbi:MAG: hypothetical protein AAFY28_15780 [Actinomycetota bacterium]